MQSGRGRIWLNMTRITIALYSFYCMQGVMLAFADRRYSAALPVWTRLITYSSICFGWFTVLERRKAKGRNVFLLILPVTYWLYLAGHTWGGYRGDWSVALLAVSAFVLFPAEMKRRIFKGFFLLLLANNIAAMFMWICYMLRIDIGFREVIYYGSKAAEMGETYIRWLIFAIYKNPDELRLCGVFNEPGGLGTICALMFIATYPCSRRWQKALLLAAGSLTFSLAFFLLVFLFAGFYLIRKKRRNVIWIGFLIAAFLAAPEIDWGSPALNRLAGRIAVTEHGLAGDNRNTGAYMQAYKEFKGSPDVWLGKGAGYALTPDMSGNSSFRKYIVCFGYIGTAILAAEWVFFCFRRAGENKDALLLALLFVASLYQRPGAITEVYGYVLLFGGFAYLKHREEEADGGVSWRGYRDGAFQQGESPSVYPWPQYGGR